MPVNKTTAGMMNWMSVTTTLAVCRNPVRVVTVISRQNTARTGLMHREYKRKAGEGCKRRVSAVFWSLSPSVARTWMPGCILDVHSVSLPVPEGWIERIDNATCDCSG
jgi:hypothetical protein